MSFSKKVRNLDIFKKVPKDLSEATNLGGAISILTVLFIFFLIYKEFSNYLNPEYTGEINFDKLVTREEMTYNMQHLELTWISNFPPFLAKLFPWTLRIS